MTGGRWGYRMGDAAIIDSMLRDGLNDAFSGRHSGWHTEDLVTRSQISRDAQDRRSEEHTSALQSLMCISYAVFCLKKKNKTEPQQTHTRTHNIVIIATV